MLATLIIAAALFVGAPQSAAAGSPETVTGTDSNKGGEQQQIRETIGQMPASPAVTRHAVVVAGKELGYTATAGMLPIVNDAGETEAHIFYIAYTAGSQGPGSRPLMFLFNGGPGSSSVWLHMGAAGPKRVRMLADGRMPPPPYLLADNESTWLDRTDLVFIDPVGTGYSRAVKPELARKFSSVGGDIDAVGRFIRLYLSRNDRWQSPLFLAGESYGTFRAAGLSEYLAEHGIALNGIVLVSSILNMQTISFNNGNDLPYQLALPSYTATAWYHRKLSPELQVDLDKTLAAAELWAGTAYLTALDRGDRLTADERRVVVDGVARYTGLDRSLIDSLNLRVEARSFVRELLRERGETVGTMDSRFTAPNPEPATPHVFDPTVAAIRPPFTATFNEYVRSDLGFRTELEYFILGGGIGSWDWEAKNSYADTSDNLRNTLAKNPYMKLFVGSGLFDLATPLSASDYTLAHLGLPPSFRKNIVSHRYRAGHMFYLDSVARARLKRDLAEFIDGAAAPRTGSD